MLSEISKTAPVGIRNGRVVRIVLKYKTIGFQLPSVEYINKVDKQSISQLISEVSFTIHQITIISVLASFVLKLTVAFAFYI